MWRTRSRQRAKEGFSAVMTPAQCRAARALLDWPSERLAARTGLAETQVSRFEAGDSGLSPQEQDAVKKALEQAGAIFFDEDETVDGGPGVRLRKTTHDEGLRPDQLTTENDR